MGIASPIIACAKKLLGIKDPPPKKEETHFINFNIVDEGGKPLSNVTIKVILPDGSIEERTTDKAGKIEIKNIKPGKCKLEFDWKKQNVNKVVLLKS